MKVTAPAKLILSGEHAVVYGHPALAMAVNRYVTATVTREQRPQILFDLADLAHRSRLSFQALRALKDRVKNKYQQFIRGEIGIREVLKKPSELAKIALGVFTESSNISLPYGVKIHLQSDIPIGCGMGSSAATILCVMYAAASHLQMPLSEDKLFHLALNAENMQHGRSSGLDLHVALQGGCIFLQGQKMEKRHLPTLPLYLVNTGMPESTTGQCVEKAATHFQTTGIGSEFAAVTMAMDAAVQQQSWQSFRETVRNNHQLLCAIGVVPDKVRQFISQIETTDGAAKICGAGAITGDKGGVVLMTAEDKNHLAAVCSRFGYTLMPIICEPRGVHAI